jgi:hypothetical protein
MVPSVVQRLRGSIMRSRVGLLLICLLTATSVHAASIEKARALKTNGLLREAKSELVELSFSDAAPAGDKAEALLLLGDIGVEEGKPEVAAENWSKVTRDYPQEAAAKLASEKLASLSNSGAHMPAKSEGPKSQSFPSGTLLVVGPREFPWSIPQIAASLGSHATPFDGSIAEAMVLAKSNREIVGVAEISLSVDTAFESGRVVCSLPSGTKVWEEKVMFNLGGGAERIARRFVDSLAKRVAGRPCPGSSR